MIWRWLFAMLIVLGSLGLGLAVILTDWGKILAVGLMITVIICVVKMAIDYHIEHPDDP